MSSSVDESFTPRMNSYQSHETFNKKEKKGQLAFDNTTSGKAASTSYTPVGERPSFENPVYESSPTFEPSILLEATTDEKDLLYDDIKDVKYEFD